MIKVAGVSLLVLAAVLVVWGLQASGSLQSDLSRLLRGEPTDRTAWLFMGSAAAGGVGLVLLRGYSRHESRAPAP